MKRVIPLYPLLSEKSPLPLFISPRGGEEIPLQGYEDVPELSGRPLDREGNLNIVLSMEKEGRIRVVFPYNPLFVKRVRTIEERCWSLPPRIRSPLDRLIAEYIEPLTFNIMKVS